MAEDNEARLGAGTGNTTPYALYNPSASRRGAGALRITNSSSSTAYTVRVALVPDDSASPLVDVADYILYDYSLAAKTSIVIGGLQLMGPNQLVVECSSTTTDVSFQFIGVESTNGLESESSKGVLGTLSPGTNVTSIYNPPANKKAIGNVIICNRSGSARDAALLLADDDTDGGVNLPSHPAVVNEDIIWYGSIPANDYVIIRNISVGDVECLAGNASSSDVSYVVTGIEYDV